MESSTRGWPNEELRLFGPGTVEHMIISEASGKVGTRGDYTASEDDHVLVRVATDKSALGFLDYLL